MAATQITGLKSSLRKHFREIRKEQSEQTELANRASHLLKRLEDYLSKISFETILFYHPIAEEVPVISLAKEYFKQKNVLFPRVDKSDEKSMIAIEAISMDGFLPGFKNIPEPIGEQFRGDIDIVVVPGLAFCKSNEYPNRYYRLGYGGGFYDRFLRDHPEGLKIGVFYEYAKCRVDFHMDYDVPLDLIISEDMIYDSKSNF